MTGTMTGGWDSFDMNKKGGPKAGAAEHLNKVSLLKDACNLRWQTIVSFGHWLTTDESSRHAGWYHSIMIMEPKPKSICTGLRIKSLCITCASLMVP